MPRPSLTLFSCPKNSKHKKRDSRFLSSSLAADSFLEARLRLSRSYLRIKLRYNGQVSGKVHSAAYRTFADLSQTSTMGWARDSKGKPSPKDEGSEQRPFGLVPVAAANRS